MKTIFVFAGTRPEIIKMAPVVRELRAREKSAGGAWKPHFCFSGQHLELALPFLEFFELEPDSRLELMSAGQSLGQLTSRAAAQIDEFFGRNAAAGQGVVLVQGDTTTAFVAALVAFYRKLAVGHVEAGLRTSDISEPFPEEANRRLITRLASWHYAPTPHALETLLSERVAPASTALTGNTGIDSLLWAVGRDRQPASREVRALEGRRLVLVTVHRRENIGEPLERITRALSELARRFSEVEFILPVHKNPSVVETVTRGLSGIGNFHLVDPLEYGDLVWVMKRAELILSDSGGIQEEAPSLKKPVLVLRNDTERPEAVAFGTSLVVGSDPAKIVSLASEFLSGKRPLDLKPGPNPYGDGRAAIRIVSHVLGAL